MTFAQARRAEDFRASLLPAASFMFRVPPAASELPKPPKPSAGKKKSGKGGGKAAIKAEKERASLLAKRASDPVLFNRVGGCAVVSGVGSLNAGCFDNRHPKTRMEFLLWAQSRLQKPA